MTDKIAKFLATFFYIGKIPVAPGTFGSLPAFPICYMIVYFVENNKIVFNISEFNITTQLLITVFLIGLLATFILFVIGTIATAIYIKDRPDDDPKEVVIDEVVGQMLVIVLTAVSILFVYASTMPLSFSDTTLKIFFLFIMPFALFRFFDAVKPWPIGWLDQNVKGAFGVMIDDIAAAIFASIIHFAIVFCILNFYTLPGDIEMVEDKEIKQIVHDIKENAGDRISISTAESCTGGMVSTALTSIEGSSLFFERGFVTYSNEAKKQMLSVKQGTLDEFGAVSEETAKEMAAGCLNYSSADFAVSITGIAGPGGGSETKPVGTVCFGIADINETKSYTYRFAGNREDIRKQACIKALKLLSAKISNFS